MKRKIRSTFRKRQNQNIHRPSAPFAVAPNWRDRPHATSQSIDDRPARAVNKRINKGMKLAWAALRGGWGAEAREAEIAIWRLNPATASLF